MSPDLRPAHAPKSSRTLAITLVAACILASMVGVFQLAKTSGESTKKATETPTAADSTGAMVSWLGVSNKKDHLQLIELSGPISMEDSGQGPSFLKGESNAMTARKALDKAAKNDAVKGVLLRIDSPGGTVGMSQELNAAVQRVRAKKPIVASFGDLAASGGYYTACAADKIVSNPGTLTGSIGVIMSTLNFKGLATDKLGIKAVTIKSGKFKDLLSPFKETSPDEVKLLQDLIGVSYKQFLGAVLEGRTRAMKDKTQRQAMADKITAIADGRVLVGTDALQAGLVDQIGDEQAAHHLLSELAKARFNLSGKEDLALEDDHSTQNGLLDSLGIGSFLQGVAQRSGLANSVLPAIPFSMQHTHQPLWMME